jgi:hypothetical protein
VYFDGINGITFNKKWSSGTIYGSNEINTTLKNTVGEGGGGYAVYVYDTSTPKKRDATTGPNTEDNLVFDPGTSSVYGWD